jgi:HEAT repeat protein
MGFKVDASFLRFLTMGAVGVRAVQHHLTTHGFVPIELERYCTTNKIWSTKVKRLRLPDLLCVRTGLRIEVRAKSALCVKMSDALANPERRWDAGLRDEDLVAFVPCTSTAETIEARNEPLFFSVYDLRASETASKLGSPKSAAEGAERDREWPTTVPKSDGIVLTVDDDRIATRLASGRSQTYQLRSKHAYVVAGERFCAGTSFLAGVISRPTSLEGLTLSWNPALALRSKEPIDRYAAAKAIPHREGGPELRTEIESLIGSEPEPRVALEMAASATRLGSEQGMQHVVATVWAGDRGDLSMEGVLILTELGTGDAADELVRVAGDEQFNGQEIRQAAVWGLGKGGAREYACLLPFIADNDEAVALHAIAGFGQDTPRSVADELVALLRNGSPRERASASLSLSVIASEDALAAVISSSRSSLDDDTWLVATLGRFHPDDVRQALNSDPLLDKVEPLLLLSEQSNWLATRDVLLDFQFLRQQGL